MSLFSRREHAVRAAQESERQNHVRVLAALQVVAQNLVGHRPDKINPLLIIVHVI